ncbi:ligand-binding sensor domain-containing protein/DNA-binding response OmpR family regulator/nitrogen-specific signal transduction histidine kinase [Algoriphagus sp. 4150]|uniref:hybrid sensor histidine kinase/response regulator transcription factor n=1 Tax=Algoriphagus sp. 4150 TaxID=2817756 RepID=UPI00285EE1A8|nr:two-component regulator propeller domain-containing protein [Algoriphagus sp. 4150]MDR7128623.1 ligand-binding sensor domain-containing protein/DNA-binding response OmpR family regulator/nitrogen-specific signal transduction histidine kinase [Algoriphagus sp. 4150]
MTLSKSLLAGLLSLSFLLCSVGPGLAQEKRYYFRHYDVYAGLSHNSVFSIFQDSEGFMWFGTKYGLSRFDGQRWKSYNTDSKGDPSTILGNDYVHAIHEDRDGILWIGTDEGLYLYDKTLDRFSPLPYKTENGTFPTGIISSLAEDQAGNIWIGGNNRGIFRFDFEKKELILFSHDPGKKGSIPAGDVSSVKVDDNNVVWISIIGNGVGRFQEDTETFAMYMDDEKKLPQDFIIGLQDWGDFILIGTKNSGVKKMEKSSGKVTDLLLNDENGAPLFVRDMFQFSKNELGIGTESGLFIYDFVTKTYQHLQENADDPYSLANNAIYSLWKDTEGGIWVGSYFGGVNYLPNQPVKFEKYYPITNVNTISGRRVREIVGNGDGRIWIGTEDAGLNLFDPQTGTFEHLPVGDSDSQLSYRNVHGLAKKGDKLLVGTFTGGLNIIDARTGKIKKINSGTQGAGLTSDDIFSILIDSRDRVWLGTPHGMFVSVQEDRFRKVEELKNYFVYNILEDHNGNIWAGTYNDGLIRLNPDSFEISQYTPDPAKEGSIPHHTIIDVFEDSQHTIWVATTGGGFAKFNEKDQTFKTYSVSSGFPASTYYKIIEDNHGVLWITSNKGLIQFDPSTETIRLYDEKSGLIPSPFNYRSGYKAEDGTLYFGSQGGLISFHPEKIETPNFQPELIFTRVELFNQEIPIDPDGGILTKSIVFTDEIILEHDQNSLTFEVASLGFTNSQSWNFAYRMDGLEEEWRQMNDSQTISYSYLPPGDYRLIVRAPKNPVTDSYEEVQLKIVILPPFYLTPLAYAFYALLTILVAYWLISMYKRRVNNRHLVQINLLEAEKEKELYEAKIEFFTNITHEIRTPLTLIKGPLEDILSKDRNCDPEVKNDLLIIEKNTNRLIDLSNQLLDFRKTEQRGFKLSFLKTEICGILDELYIRFKVTAGQSGLNFTIQKSTTTLFADVDKEAVTKILSNLLINALKNAESMIHIRLHYDPDHPYGFKIEISNDGHLIPKDMAEKIFEPFFQIGDNSHAKAKQGTGLGLPLAKSLAEMHHGSLMLSSDSELNRFVLELPVKQKEAIHFDEENDTGTGVKITVDSEVSADKTVSPKKKGSLPAILLVEDNKELLQFLGEKLKGKYVIHKAANGLLALDVLAKEPIDLVISDVMMPEMDGFKLCERIKSDLATSHIPVLLLTAKNNMNAKITGLEMGADVYLEKPFSLEFLYLQIKNLLQHRDQIKKAFASLPLVNSDTIAHSKADEEFLKKINEAILANIENELFGVSELADQLHMSQSSLLRKIKGISELTPNGYIRLVRLKRSAELLGDGLHSIAEISEMVGFNSPSYFTKCFQKHFGELPKDFSKKSDVL